MPRRKKLMLPEFGDEVEDSSAAVEISENLEHFDLDVKGELDIDLSRKTPYEVDRDLAEIESIPSDKKRARGPTKSLKLSNIETQNKIIFDIAKGHTLGAALAHAGVSRRVYAYYLDAVSRTRDKLGMLFVQRLREAEDIGQFGQEVKLMKLADKSWQAQYTIMKTRYSSDWGDRVGKDKDMVQDKPFEVTHELVEAVQGEDEQDDGPDNSAKDGKAKETVEGQAD